MSGVEILNCAGRDGQWKHQYVSRSISCIYRQFLYRHRSLWNCSRMLNMWERREQEVGVICSVLGARVHKVFRTWGVTHWSGLSRCSRNPDLFGGMLYKNTFWKMKLAQWRSSSTPTTSRGQFENSRHGRVTIPTVRAGLLRKSSSWDSACPGKSSVCYHWGCSSICFKHGDFIW